MTRFLPVLICLTALIGFSLGLGWARAQNQRSVAICMQHCDSASHMPQLNEYLIWLQHEVAAHAKALNIPMQPKPGTFQTRSNTGGSTDPNRTAGWGNGTWP